MDVIDNAAYDAVDLLEAYASKKTTPLQVLQGVTEQIARRNPEINAFAEMSPAALVAARESTLRWHEGKARALEGVPVTVSDLIDVAGLPTRRGSKTIQPIIARRDAPVVAVLRAAGAVIIGKTNVSEFGWKYQGDSPLSGIIRNPWNTLHTAGGASGGAAAAAAAFFAPLHVADGTVCVAASWSGVVGLKLGSISENQGIIARSVADIELLTGVLESKIRVQTQAKNVQSIKIGILKTPGFMVSTSDSGCKAVEQAREVLQTQGAVLSEINIELNGLEKVFLAFWGAKCLKNIQEVGSQDQALLDPELLKFAEQLEKDIVFDEAVFQTFCSQASKAIENLDVDVILCPTVARTAPLVTTETPDPARAMVEDWAAWTMLFTLAGHSTLTLPIGVDAEGLPVSVQVASKKVNDEMIFSVAKTLEDSLG